MYVFRLLAWAKRTQRVLLVVVDEGLEPTPVQFQVSIEGSLQIKTATKKENGNEEAHHHRRRC
jgi:hypothetical protein